MRILNPPTKPSVHTPELDGGASYEDEAVSSANLWIPFSADCVSWSRLEKLGHITPKLTYDPRPIMKNRDGQLVRNPDGSPMRYGNLDAPEPIPLVREHEHHLEIPRFLCPEMTAKLDWRHIDLADTWAQLDYGLNVSPRNAAQEEMWAALDASDGGTLNLACGKGKTVAALRKIAMRGYPAIVLVHNQGLAEQWRQRALQFYSLQDEDIGMVSTGLGERDIHVPSGDQMYSAELTRVDRDIVRVLAELESWAWPGFNPLSRKEVARLVDTVCNHAERMDYLQEGASLLGRWADAGKAPFTLLREHTALLYRHRVLLQRFDGHYPTWSRPLVITTVQALVTDITTLPPWIRQRFGTVVFDEAHHSPAATFTQALDVFHGARFSLTATPEREDGLERIMYAHTGPTIYTDMVPEYPATIHFRNLTTRLPMDDEKVRTAVLDKRRRISLGKLYQYLATDRIRNRQIIRKYLIPPLEHGRDCLILTQAEVHPQALADEFALMCPELAKTVGVGVITGATPGKMRTAILESSRATFATTGVALEGLDAPRKDTAVMATPFTSLRIFLQSKGRVERLLADKPNPLYIVITDNKIDILNGMARALKRKIETTSHAAVD